MLSTVTIIGIFVEIFATGILLAGAFALIKKYFSDKQISNLLSSLVFLSFAGFVSANVASQMLFNLGAPLPVLEAIQKFMAVSLVLCGTLIWCFTFEKYKLNPMRFSYPFIFLIAAGLSALIYYSNVHLLYREETIEPVVIFSLTNLIRPFFALTCLGLVLVSLQQSWRQKDGEKVLTLHLSMAGLLLFLAPLFIFLYIRFGDSNYLLFSWILNLAAWAIFLLAELVPPQSPEAKTPWLFLKTRLLFKLLLIFVLLIVILFETTTLATIYIGKKALSHSIQNNYLRIAQELENDIAVLPAPPSKETLQKLVTDVRTNPQGQAFIVDNKGCILAHPDRKRALQCEIVTQNQAVKKLLAGQKGADEFKDELGNIMVGAYVPVNKFGWGIIVQEPLTTAYFELRKLETNSLLFVVMGIIITTLTGVFFARSIEKPIKELTNGTEAVAKGDLYWSLEVKSQDEIGRLAEAFNRMTKDLRDSQERLILSEKLASLGTMAAGMAHEIKNPLVSVRTFTQLLQQKWEDKEFRDKFSTIVPHEVDRINRIAESLLKFGRPMRPELTQVDINGLLDEVLMLFESETKKYNIRVTKKLADLPSVTGDAGQFQQAFVNIIKNAIEAMHAKGGELVVKTDIGEVFQLGKADHKGQKVGDEMVWGKEEQGPSVPVVFIEISDSGEGIDETNLKSLFDPFFTTKMTGTGMGLPITLRIIEEHKGSIKVRSQKGKGTTFIIILPQKA